MTDLLASPHYRLYFLSDCHETSHVFTNIISCRSLRFDLLRSKTRATSNLTDLTEFLFLIQLSRNFTHVFTNIISCKSSLFDLLWSKTGSTSNLTDLTDFCISYPIVTKLHTCVHKHHLLYEFAFRPSEVQKRGQHRI